MLQHRRTAGAEREDHGGGRRKPAPDLVEAHRLGPALDGQPQGQFVEARVMADDHDDFGGVALVLQRRDHLFGLGVIEVAAKLGAGAGKGGRDGGGRLTGPPGAGGQDQVRAHAVGRQQSTHQGDVVATSFGEATLEIAARGGLPFGLAVAHEDQMVHATSIAFERRRRKRAVDTFFAKRSKAAWLI
jgi:hypothetical protein